MNDQRKAYYRSYLIRRSNDVNPKQPMRLLPLGVFVLGLTTAHLAQAAYVGLNPFGSWASATADTTTSTSGASE